MCVLPAAFCTLEIGLRFDGMIFHQNDGTSSENVVMYLKNIVIWINNVYIYKIKVHNTEQRVKSETWSLNALWFIF